jgi:RNA 2',3'-cyclic 3'-phosphodiesterase
MRVFVAVPLPEAVKLAIRSYQQVYRHKWVRFVPEENLHLTLHFIGEVPDETLPLLQDQLRQAVAGHAPFTLTFLETAPGPKARSPRLIWTRFEEHPAFAALSTAICQALEATPGSYGKFIPHITIARLRKDRGPVPDLAVLRDPIIPNLEVKNFALWLSKLQSPHPVYSILASFPLTNSLQTGIT